MTSAGPSLTLPLGLWYDDAEVTLDFPPGWRVHRLDPADAPALDDAQVMRALAEPLGTPTLEELARGKRRAVIAVDDLTRPTPVHRFLPAVIDALHAGGLGDAGIRILLGTAAHRPMQPDEVAKKLGPALAGRLTTVAHDFAGPDNAFVGWVDGGPVHLNRAFLDADLRICVGGVIPHNETGFGGGAKMVVPGLAGVRTISHFHGALPPREAGALEAAPGVRDRRAWSEAVARHVGVDAVVCANVNARAELAGLVVGDLVQAHRAAARRAREIGRTPVPRGLAERADAVVVNCYPLDTDPIQMGKSITIARKFRAPLTLVVNAASDGIFYHGMGMGSGVDPARLLRNLPGWLVSPTRVGGWLRGLATALPAPVLAARLSYFHLNPLAWEAFQAGRSRGDEHAAPPTDADADPMVWSARFPAWGFRRKYRRGALYREWPALRDALAVRRPEGEALAFAVAPLQLPEIT